MGTSNAQVGFALELTAPPLQTILLGSAVLLPLQRKMFLMLRRLNKWQRLPFPLAVVLGSVAAKTTAAIAAWGTPAPRTVGVAKTEATLVARRILGLATGGEATATPRTVSVEIDEIARITAF